MSIFREVVSSKTRQSEQKGKQTSQKRSENE